MCRICSDDMPRECMYTQRHSYGGGYGHTSSFSSLLMLVSLCACALCLFSSREPDMIMVGGPGGYPQQGQVVYAQQGGYGYGPGGYDHGMGMAGAAGTGFVGGMLVGEMMDHGHMGGMGGMGYGGGYGDMGGMGMGGGDMGFGADQ